VNNYPDFFVSSQTTRIDISKDHWVDVKTEMSIGDWEKYEAAMLQITAEESSNRDSRRRGMRGSQRSQAAPQIKMGAGLLDLLEINIVQWSFEEVTINRDNIAKIKEPQAQIILDRIGELNPDNPLGENGQSNLISSTKTSSKVVASPLP
jgi:hypothetical protein